MTSSSLFKHLLFVAVLLSLLLACASAVNPAHDLFRQQVWELTHIFVWGVSGLLIFLILFLCGVVFLCTNCLCVARRLNVSSTGRVDASLNARSKFIAIVLFITLVVLFAFLVLNINFSSQLNAANDDVNYYLYDRIATLSQALDSNLTCSRMDGQKESESIQQQCVQIENSISDFTPMAQQINEQFHNSTSSTIYTLYGVLSLFVFFCALCAVGACCRVSGLVRLFVLSALFFAAFFILVWLTFGLPTTIIHHDCRLVHLSFMNNNSNLFPGMPLIALVYNITNGFQEWDSFDEQFNDDMNHLNQIDFRDLSSDQEEAFQMVRTCLWDGITLNSTLDTLNLRTTMDSSLNLMKEVSKRLEKNLIPHGLSLPGNFSQELNSIEWGRPRNDSQSKSTLEIMIDQINDLITKIEDRKSEMSHSDYKNLTGDSNLLVSQTLVLDQLIDLTDCRHYKHFYQNFNELFCHGFIYYGQALAWSFLFSAALTLVVFLVGFCAAYRIFSRLKAYQRLLDEENHQHPHRVTTGGPTFPQNTNTSTSDVQPLLSTTFEQKQPFYSPTPGYSYYGTAPVSYQPMVPPYNPSAPPTSAQKL